MNSDAGASAGESQGMSSGAKWALGCGLAAVAVLLVCGGLMGLGFMGAWMAKEFVEEFGTDFQNIAGQGEVGKLYSKARTAAPFERPAGDLISEGRFKVFLGIRKQIAGFFKENEERLKKIKGKSEGNIGFGDIKDFIKLWSKLKLVHARALVEKEMSMEEYRYIAIQLFVARYVKDRKVQEHEEFEPPRIHGIPRKVPAENRALFEKFRSEVDEVELPGLDFFLISTDADRYKHRKY